jgi:alkaline phosphatase
LVLVFPDHNTGGLSLGNYNPEFDYTSMSYEKLVGPLEGMTVTSNVVASVVGDVNVENVQTAILDYWGIEISPESAQDIIDLAPVIGLNYAIAHVVSNDYTAFGWTTFGHTGEDVPLWTYAPQGVHRPVGLYDNTELATLCADAMGFELEDIQEELFISLSEVLENDQWSVEGPEENPIIEIVLPDTTITINAGTDIIERSSGSYIHLKGVVVYAPMTGEVYVPQDALNYMVAYGLSE